MVGMIALHDWSSEIEQVGARARTMPCRCDLLWECTGWGFDYWQDVIVSLRGSWVDHNLRAGVSLSWEKSRMS